MVESQSYIGVYLASVYSGVASGPTVPPGGTRNLKKNEEMFYSEAKLTAFLILKSYIIMIILQCFHSAFLILKIYIIMIILQCFHLFI
jgi:hypothetical protein